MLLQKDTNVIDNVLNSEWQEWNPAMLRQPKNDLLILPTQIDEIEAGNFQHNVKFVVRCFYIIFLNF